VFLICIKTHIFRYLYIYLYIIIIPKIQSKIKEIGSEIVNKYIPTNKFNLT